MQLTKEQARIFILAHQQLLPPRHLQTKEEIMDFVARVGCIQYDPLDQVGSNPNLVLQSRVKDYQPDMLAELLYKDRKLVDGWDKNAAIYSVEDWPYFHRYRTRMIRRYGHELSVLHEILPKVIEAIQTRGPLSSIDLDYDAKVDWFWAPAKASRAAMETLFSWGDLVVFKRIGTRRVYDLSYRHIPDGLLNMPDPHQTDEEYFQWHVKRRIDSLGLLWNRGSDAWLAISGLKGPQRAEAITALEMNQEITRVVVEGINYPVYVSKEQLPLLEQVKSGLDYMPRAAFIAPLDNLLWDRKLIKDLFGFEYTWEVYKPAALRKYGYYVLPVLYGDKFVARFEPKLNKKTKTLEILDWWWEPGVKVTSKMKIALAQCMRDFKEYLGAITIDLRGNDEIHWLEL